MNLFIVGLDEFFQGPAGQRWTLLLASGGFHPQYQRERLTVDSVRENHRDVETENIANMTRHDLIRDCVRKRLAGSLAKKLQMKLSHFSRATTVFVGRQFLDSQQIGVRHCVLRHVQAFAVFVHSGFYRCSNGMPMERQALPRTVAALRQFADNL